MKIITIKPSDKKNKKFKAVLEGGKEINFGSRNSKTYVDGADDVTRTNYLKRHLANKIERNLITKKIMSPSLLSASILWGKSHDINKNLETLNKQIR